jgi:hypothetical protein
MGLGMPNPDGESLRLDLEIPQENWIEFCYDDLMDQSAFNQIVVAALASGAEDYLDDISTYFFSRLEIQLRLKGSLRENPDAIILSYSLGTVVAYEALKKFSLKAHTFFCLGSPLSKGIVKRFLKVPAHSRLNVLNRFNIWSFFDPISGKIEDLGC